MGAIVVRLLTVLLVVYVQNSLGIITNAQKINPAKYHLDMDNRAKVKMNDNSFSKFNII
jgi:hypothetical protein